MEPPKSPPADLPPDESRGHVLVEIAIAFLIVDLFFVILRFFSRRLQHSKLRLEDGLIIASYIVIVGTVITSIYGVRYGGVGRHLPYLTYEERATWLKTVFIAGTALYLISGNLPKLVIISMYLKLFVDKPSRYICWFVAVILIIGPIVEIPILIVQCRPIAFLWDKSIKNGHCFDQSLMFRYGPLPNIITDVIMLILPMPLIWKLHASVKVKLGLLATFLLASVGLITSILRFVAFFESLKDGTWVAVPLLTWVIVEPSIYLIAACLLSIRPLLRYIVQESKNSRLLSRTWYGISSGKERTAARSAGNGLSLKQKSTDGDSGHKILRERDIYIESTHNSRNDNSDDIYGLQPIPAANGKISSRGEI